MADSAQVTFSMGTLPEGECFTSEQLRANAIAANLVGQLPGNFSTFNYGPNTPGVNDRDKPWIKTNTDGSQDGVYTFFNGAWRRPVPLPEPGFIGIWDGDPALVPTLDGGTAGTATIFTGPFWEIVTALSARFPVGVGTFTSGLAVAAAGTGGEERVTLKTENLPTVLGSLIDPFTKLVGISGSGGTNGEVAGPGNVKQDILSNVLKGGTDATDKSHNNLPPWYGVSFIRRTIRLYINA